MILIQLRRARSESDAAVWGVLSYSRSATLWRLAHVGRHPYIGAVPVKIAIEDDDARGWVAVAHGSRILQHCLRNTGDPTPRSPFAQVGELYPFEKVSDRARAYLAAAIEHLIFWADLQAPLKFHPEQATEVTLRPSYTLARASLESAAQAVWLMNTRDPMECIRRHICLMRWDLQELRKSKLDMSEKAKAKAVEEELLHRVSEVFADERVRAPQGYLDVIRSACAANGLTLEPDDAERIWRAASGVAHGKYWPTLELQQVVPVEEYEQGQFRSVQIPDVDGITEVLRAAHAVTQFGVLRFLDYSGVDIASSIASARDWLSEVIPLKEGVDREDLRPHAEWPGDWDVP